MIVPHSAVIGPRRSRGTKRNLRFAVLAIQAGVPGILMWYSGKDLLAGLTQWLQTAHNRHPTEVRNRIRDWVIDHPEETLKLLPEWDALRNLLRSYP